MLREGNVTVDCACNGPKEIATRKAAVVGVNFRIIMWMPLLVRVQRTNCYGKTSNWVM